VGGKLLFNKSSTTFLINSTFGNFNWKKRCCWKLSNIHEAFTSI